MKRNDFIFWYNTELLLARTDLFETLLIAFGEQFELQEQGKVDAVSIAVEPADNDRISFTEWLTSIRNEEIEHIRLLPVPMEYETLAPHIVAAFASSADDTYLSVKTKSGTKCYVLHTFYSSPYELSPEDFVNLIDAQILTDDCWALITDLLQEHYSLNQGPDISGEDIREYMLSHRDDNTYDFIVSKCISEVQVECMVSEEPLIIPEELTHALYQSDFDFGTDPEHTSVFLYTLREVTAEEIMELVTSQPFSETEIWERCVSVGAEYGREDLPLDAAEWTDFVNSKTLEELSDFSYIICRAIATLCEDIDLLNPVIPVSLPDAFGPDELDQRRAQARSSMGNKQWYLSPAKHPWESYIFKETGAIIPEDADENIEDAGNRYKESLHNIKAFAEKIESTFAEAFGLGLYLLEYQLPLGNYDEGHLEHILSAMRKKRFSERALQNFENYFRHLAPDAIVMHTSADQLAGILSVAIVSDLFGGMGSWNDIYMETEEEQETFNNISAEAYAAVRNYFRVLMSR